MIQKFITKEHGHWRISGAMRAMLKQCMAKESFRYALNCVSIEKNSLTSTDGRKLVNFSYAHKITKGLYHVTQDGFLLEWDEDGTFPKYKDILLDPKKCKQIKAGGATPEQVFSSVVYHCNRADMGLDIFMLQKSLMVALKACDHNECIIDMKDGDSALQLNFEVSAKADRATVMFMQIPFSIK